MHSILNMIKTLTYTICWARKIMINYTLNYFYISIFIPSTCVFNADTKHFLGAQQTQLNILPNKNSCKLRLRIPPLFTNIILASRLPKANCMSYYKTLKFITHQMHKFLQDYSNQTIMVKNKHRSDILSDQFQHQFIKALQMIVGEQITTYNKQQLCICYDSLNIDQKTKVIENISKNLNLQLQVVQQYYCQHFQKYKYNIVTPEISELIQLLTKHTFMLWLQQLFKKRYTDWQYIKILQSKYTFSCLIKKLLVVNDDNSSNSKMLYIQNFLDDNQIIITDEELQNIVTNVLFVEVQNVIQMIESYTADNIIRLNDLPTFLCSKLKLKSIERYNPRINKYIRTYLSPYQDRILQLINIIQTQGNLIP